MRRWALLPVFGLALTASAAEVESRVLTHYVPALQPGDEPAWRALAADRFGGRIELGDDLHRVELG